MPGTVRTVIIAVCGHQSYVDIPAHRHPDKPGSKGLKLLDRAKSLPCYYCRQKLIRRDPCHYQPVHGHHIVINELAGQKTPACCYCRLTAEDIVTRAWERKETETET